ncbi:MAG TPA: beta-ketoacyl-ACP synthase II [Solirubrobacteraceae bacterium]|nr:beta-ketoacyl-ACP synthase II [Solirubrobacteraceae bacterium]
MADDGRPEVVITGVGAVTPLGDARALLARWSEGECGVVDGEAPCREFDPTDHMSAKEARRMDRFTQLARVAAAQAVADAGWDSAAPYRPEQVGCIIGTGIGGLATIEDNHSLLQADRAVSPLAVPLMMGNAGAAALAIRHELRGPVYGVVAACAAGAQAVGAAMRAIQAGEASAMLAGGSEATLTPLARSAFESLGATSRSGVSRPFDARRDGFVMGEGAGVLVLEDAAAAQDRNAPVLARLRGYGATCDAQHLTAPDEDGSGAAAAIDAALADAGVSGDQVAYVNAHGTSTPLNDRSETLALKATLGDRAGAIPVSSTKSAIGHLLGAAGAVEAIVTVLALRERIAPPTLGYEQSEPGLDLDYVADGPRPLRANNDASPIALSNSFGFGGHNAVLCIQAA